MLVRLLYASRAVVPFSDEELGQVLRQSRESNPALGITGVLCYSEGIFMQVLEGGRGPVNEVYARIAADIYRHDIAIISRASAHGHYRSASAEDMARAELEYGGFEQCLLRQQQT